MGWLNFREDHHVTWSGFRVKARRDKDRIISCANRALMPIIILGQAPNRIADCIQ